MTVPSFRPAGNSLPWLLLHADGLGTVTADVISQEISVNYDRFSSYGSSVRLSCDLEGTVQRKERYPGEQLWDAVLSWERPDRSLPADIAALQELGRRHPGELAAIRMLGLRVVSTWEDG